MEKMTRDEFGALLNRCYKNMEYKQNKLIAEYGLDKYDRCSFDFNRNLLNLFKNGRIDIQFKAYPLGTWDPKDKTWIWAWANPSFPETAKNGSVKLKEFLGVSNDGLFRTSGFQGEEKRAYEAVAIALEHMGAMGMYKLNNEDSNLFLAIIDKVKR